MSIKKIAINGNRRQLGFTDKILKLIERLRAYGVTIIMSEKFAAYLTDSGLNTADIEVIDLSTPPFEAELALSFGGDGTFLRTNRWVEKLQIPVAGVNTGHLGYLADYDLADSIDWIDDILRGNFKVESRTMLEVSVAGDKPIEGFPAVALNEVALLKRDSASMIEISASADSTFLARYRADGVLISTPTGSTAYNLSVGGPILQPTVPVVVIAPIAPHSIGLRPMVISDDARLRFNVKSRAESFLLSVDGNSTPLPSGTEISIGRCSRFARVALRPNHDYADALRAKLQWG